MAGVAGLMGLGASLTAMTVSANTGTTHATSTCSGFTADVYLDNNVNNRLVVVTSTFPGTTGSSAVYTTTSESELYAQTHPIWDATGAALTGISTVTLTIYNGDTLGSGIEVGPPTAGYSYSVGAPTGCQATPTLSTKLSASSAVSPATVTDTATLSGANEGATGAITISAYSGNNVDACIAGDLVSSQTASPATDGNGSYTATFSGLTVGSYEFQATYAGDGSNSPAKSECGNEPLTVSQSASNIATLLSESTITVGGSVIDTATLSDATSAATGTITISVYSGNNSDACVAGNLVSSETASPVTDGNGSYTATFSSLAVGDYEFQASYAGDSNNLPSMSGCDTEPLTVGRAASSISTLLSHSTITAGGSVTDTATLSGASSSASGTITISAYSGTSESACSGTPIASETASPTTDGNGNYTATFSSLAAGDYEFQASYAGDGNNLPSESGCGSEQLTVNRATSSIGTLLSASTITFGGSVIDTATLRDATSSASGTITISAYSGTSDSACSGTAIASETASPTTDGNGSYTATFSSLAPGDYEFQASYAGDGNNLPSESGCGSEPLTVNRVAPAISTGLSSSAITVGGSVTDTATLSGATGSASGDITISVFSATSESACSGDAIATETASPTTDGNGSYTATFSSLEAGNYEFQASFAGDGDNLPAESGCGTEPLTVNKAAPSISTKLSSSTAAVHGSVTDTATLSGATSDASGMITVSVFSGTSSIACSGTAIASETASPATNGDGSYTATFSSLAAGEYEFQASYAGDSNNLAAKSECGTEPLTVSSPVGGVLGASTTTPTTGADLVGPGLVGALALLLGGLLIMVGSRVQRLRSR
jgi:hypothetical protein